MDATNEKNETVGEKDCRKTSRDNIFQLLTTSMSGRAASPPCLV